LKPAGKLVEQSRFVTEILLPCGYSVIPSIDNRFTQFKLVTGASPIDRWGIFAGEPIPPKRVVCEYAGEWITPEQAEYRSLRERNYIFEWSADWAIDGAIGGSGAQFVNHGCDPNLLFRVWQRRVFLVSLRQIAEGEELTLDYHLSKELSPLVCRCGAANCCGLMNTCAK